MITKRLIQQESASLGDLKNVVDSYEEIAATRIRRTRDSVLRSRNFLEELNTIFLEVKASYKNRVEMMMKAKGKADPKKFSFLDRNGKTLYVFISANTGFYGEIIRKTFDLFIKNERMRNADIAIIGKLGQELYKGSHMSREYKYFDFPDQSIDKEKLVEIVNYLVQYQEVVIFYGEFQNLILQTPRMEDITGTGADIPDENKKSVLRYLFEPQLEKILEFFEKEIFSTIFEQTIRESQLSKFASRMVNLDTASENIKARLSLIEMEAQKTDHRQNNKKQNQTFASMALWHK